MTHKDDLYGMLCVSTRCCRNWPNISQSVAASEGWGGCGRTPFAWTYMSYIMTGVRWCAKFKTSCPQYLHLKITIISAPENSPAVIWDLENFPKGETPGLKLKRRDCFAARGEKGASCRRKGTVSWHQLPKMSYNKSNSGFIIGCSELLLGLCVAILASKRKKQLLGWIPFDSSPSCTTSSKSPYVQYTGAYW